VADHPLQLGDAVLITAPLIVALEEALQAFNADFRGVENN
jgi:hypothetical protein